ncbi:MAG: hypothetical protein AB7O37_00575 [Vicinamibacteria bacterium]
MRQWLRAVLDSLTPMAPAIVSYLGGLATALLLEPLRAWLFAPRLALTFEQSSYFLTRTPEVAGDTQYEALYLRVKVLNTRWVLAKSCRAYLVNIERRAESGGFQATEYCESFQLGWASQGDAAFGALNLPKGVPHFVDVLSTRSVSPTIKPQVVAVPMRYAALFAAPGEYRFTITVSGDGVRPSSMRLAVVWNGEWDKLAVKCA